MHVASVQTSEVVLNAPQLARVKQQLLTETATALHIPIRPAAVLLRRFQWDPNRLVDACVGSSVVLCSALGMTRVSMVCRFLVGVGGIALLHQLGGARTPPH